MKDRKRTKTSTENGRLWGLAAQDWANIQEQTCLRVYVEALDRLGVGSDSKFLDVGCGAGMAAAMASGRGAAVWGIDAAPTLIEIAEQRVPDAAFHIGDIEKLPFRDSSFSCVTGFNSFQYAGSPSAALSEARRVAQPGAPVLIMTWGEPEGMEASTLIAAVKPLLPPTPPEAPGPFALSNEAILREFASASGLDPVEVFDVDSPWEYPDLDTALRGLSSSGVAAKAIENSDRAAVDRAHREALRPFCKSDGSYKVGATFRCLIAKA